MQLLILCIYFFILPYMFRALISPSSGVSQAVFIYTTIWFMRCLCCSSACACGLVCRDGFTARYEQPKIQNILARKRLLLFISFPYSTAPIFWDLVTLCSLSIAILADCCTEQSAAACLFFGNLSAIIITPHCWTFSNIFSCQRVIK